MPRVAFLCLLALVVASCGDRSATGDEQFAPVLHADGPLRGLILTRGSTAEGLGVTPQLAFSPQDIEVYALIGLGDDIREGATLTVAWYRISGIDERQPLFTHEIAVGPGGSAYSQAIADGGLAPGVYETVATLGDSQVRIPWVVRVAERDAPTVGGQTGAAAESTGDEDWNVPDGGDSGWNEPQERETAPSAPGPCQVFGIHPGFEPFLDVEASVLWGGTCATISLAAAVSGPPQILASASDNSAEAAHSLNASAAVCSLPGGSDIPGTAVHWTATGSDDETATAVFALPDFGPTLEALVQSVPDAGARVPPGQRIALRGMAVVMPPALGIEKLSLRVGDQLIQEVGNASETSSPQPCDIGRYGAITHTHYEVPSDPPAVIRICARATGFDGTEAEHCIEFFTGEVWAGTMRLVFDGNVVHAGTTPPCRGVADFVMTLSVDDDGTVTGSGTISGAPYVCVVDGQEYPGLNPSGTFTVHGTKTDAMFDLVLLPDPGGGCCAAWPGQRYLAWQTPVVSPDRAEATISSSSSGGQPWAGSLTLAVNMSCPSCAEVAGG